VDALPQLLALLESFEGWRGGVVGFWALFLLFALPLFGRPRLEHPERVPRMRLYAAVGLSLWLLAWLTVVAAWLGRLPAGELGLVLPRTTLLLGWTALTFVAACLVLGGLLWLQARFGGPEPPLVSHLMPRSRAERWGFLGVAVTAGICEEWLYRGFLLYVLLREIPSAPAAVLLQAVAFGLVHGYQSRWGMGRATLLGVLLAVPVLWTGSILPSVLVHALLDVAAAFWLWPRFRERLEPPPALAEEESGEEGKG
jgi:membrane protease YdiL (CAAX protease family)